MGCLNHLIDQELSCIRIGKTFTNRKEKIEYILKIHTIIDLYDDIDNMDLTEERKKELCSMIYSVSNEEYRCNKLYIKEFMKKKSCGRNGLRETLKFVDFFVKHNPPIRMCNWTAEERRRIFYDRILFWNGIHERFKILEYVFKFQ